MTEKHPTSPKDHTTNVADEVSAPKSIVLKSFLWMLFFAALIGGSVWVAQNFSASDYVNKPEHPAEQISTYTPPTPAITPVQQPEVAELQEKLEQAKRVRLALRRDINTLKTQLAEVTQRLDSLQSTVENLQMAPVTGIIQPLASSVTQAEVATLNEKIATLQQDYEAKNQRYLARLQISQLFDSIAVRLRDGESYDSDMRQLMLLAADSGLNHEALETLSTYADDGAPSLAQLIDLFDEAAQEAVPASLAAKENPSFSDEMRGHLSRVVTIRRINADTTEDSDEAQIARAETELHMGNVDMALTHLEQLSDTPRELFSPWVSAAESHLAAQDALTQLKNALMQTRAE